MIVLWFRREENSIQIKSLLIYCPICSKNRNREFLCKLKFSRKLQSYAL